MNKYKKISILFIVLSISVNSFAWWGANGHRIVGEIADRYLNKRAKNAIAEILGDESIAMASNWADFIKSDSTMNYLSNWHYINLKSGLSQVDFNTYLQQDTATDAFTKVNMIIGQLKNKNLPVDEKKFYLRLLIHIVGDLHQPMHTGRAEDLGGNKIRIQWFGETTNLHSLWDDKLIEMQKLSYTEYATAIDHTTKDQRKTMQKQPIAEWLFESYQLSEKIYKGITQPEPKLSYRYNYDYIDDLNRQLLKGGIHLAGILNDIFG